MTLPFYLAANKYRWDGAGWEIGDKIDQATDPDIDIATITGPDGNVITISNTGCTTTGCNNQMIQFTQKNLLGEMRYEYSPSDSNCRASVREAGDNVVKYPGQADAAGFIPIPAAEIASQGGNTIGSTTYTTVCMNSAVIVLDEKTKALNPLEVIGALGGFACGLVGVMTILSDAADDKKWWAPCLYQSTRTHVQASKEDKEDDDVFEDTHVAPQNVHRRDNEQMCDNQSDTMSADSSLFVEVHRPKADVARPGVDSSADVAPPGVDTSPPRHAW